ncbi:MAG: tyrosine-type recombinase/integrase [Gracilimonas sp.]
MAYLKKRNRYYYVRYHTSVKGVSQTVTKSLKTRHKDVALKMISKLERLESLGNIDPFHPSFDPVAALKEEENPYNCRTVREAIDMFYEAKKHLSPATIAAYKRVLEYFLELNDLEKIDPRRINLKHFERVILRKEIKTATMGFYFKHLKTWWYYLKKRKIVDKDLIDQIKEELPKVRSSIRPKMISEEELMQVFEKYDEELERKKKLPEFDPRKVQHWFKPILALYYYAGLRKHEVGQTPELKYSGLKRLNLEYIDDELTFIYLGPTKGRKERFIPICKELRGYLEDYLKIRGSIKSDDYLFVYQGGPTKGKAVRGDRVYYEFKRYAKLAGVPTTRTLHGMRHQAITSWIEDGFHTAEASLMAGHSSQQVTEKYTHLSVKNLKRKLDKIEKRKADEAKEEQKKPTTQIDTVNYFFSETSYSA